MSAAVPITPAVAERPSPGRRLLNALYNRPALFLLLLLALPLALALAACGRDDAATPLFLSEEIAKAILAAALVVVDQCGHLVTMEKPEEANLILRTWLDR